MENMADKLYLSYLSFFLAFLFLSSCNKNAPAPIYDTISSELEERSEVETSTSSTAYPDFEQVSGEIVSVPYTERGGVKLLPVRVNGQSFDMIYDTGCSTALISSAEANYLYQKGLLSESDIVGKTTSQIADGSVHEDMVVNLREVIIGDKLQCTDVKAVVTENPGAPLLLGNEVLNRAAAVTVDTERMCILFKLK